MINNNGIRGMGPLAREKSHQHNQKQESQF
jgi:hypothetical protein